MTVIAVNTPEGRLTQDQRRTLAMTLTDAVLVPEVGRDSPAARGGFQVHFVERDLDMIAIGGVLLADTPEPADIMVIDIAVMNAAWPPDVRADVLRRVLTAMAEACGMDAPSPTWWVNFRVIEEGSWGSGSGPLSILHFLDGDPDNAVFTKEREQAIRAVLSSP
jgi:phenylpyruvate tautomerase PptA (4-oxalocrotonate tautomerase family)